MYIHICIHIYRYDVHIMFIYMHVFNMYSLYACITQNKDEIQRQLKEESEKHDDLLHKV